jgi:hypothetical protein
MGRGRRAVCVSPMRARTPLPDRPQAPPATSNSWLASSWLKGWRGEAGPGAEEGEAAEAGGGAGRATSLCCGAYGSRVAP